MASSKDSFTVAEQHCDLTGLPLTCRSDEALEWYNKALIAHVTYREDPLPFATRALELDDSLLLGHCLVGVHRLQQMKPPSHPAVSVHTEAVRRLSSDDSKITDREQRHARAFLVHASGDLHKANEMLVDLLVLYPLDALAIRVLQRGFTMLGDMVRLKGFLASILPHWTEEMLLYPTILAFYAFSLEENNQRDQGEEIARKALALDKNTPFAAHALTHIMEEERDAEDGVQFLTSTRDDWSHSMYNTHLTWHLALHYFDLGDMESVLREFDTVIFEKATPENVLALVDGTSLLWRLELMGIDAGERRWERLTESCSKLIGSHGLAWYDTHLMMALVHGKVRECAARLALAEQMMKSLKAYAQTDVSSNCKVAEKLGVPVCNALLAFGKEQYDEVVSILLPLRYDLGYLGGSWAQRQVFSITLIQATINSKQLPLALALVAELKAQKPCSKMLANLFQTLKTAYEEQKSLAASEL